MSYEEALDRSLDAIDRGVTIEECVSQYPEYAVQLEQTLRLLQALRLAPKPRMRAAAFEDTRAALRTRAQVPWQMHGYRTAPSSAPEVMVGQSASTDVQPPRRYTLPRIYNAVHAVTAVLALAFLLLGTYTLTRSTVTSLPGDRLYGMKRTTEDLEGILMRSANDSAAWHARQVKRRLRETMVMETRGQQVSTAFVQDVEEDIRATLDATAELAPADRDALLLAWLEDLELLQATFVGIESITLRTTIVRVETAAGVTNTPIIVPTPTLTATPTEPPSATPTSTATTTATSTATATSMPTHTVTPLPPTYTPLPTATATATQTARPTATNTRARDDDDDDRPTSTPTPRPTNTPRPTATQTPAPTATSEPTATGVPTETPVDMTPVPTTEGTPAATATVASTAETTPSQGTPTNEPTADATDVPATGTPAATAQPETPTPAVTPTPLPPATNTSEPASDEEPQDGYETTPDPEPTPGDAGSMSGEGAIPGYTPPPTPDTAPTDPPPPGSEPVPAPDAGGGDLPDDGEPVQAPWHEDLPAEEPSGPIEESTPEVSAPEPLPVPGESLPDVQEP